MAEIKVKMVIDPFLVIQNALARVKKRALPEKIVSVDYDDEADVLYVKFKHARIVDNESLDDEGLVVASLDLRGRVIGLTIMDASKFAVKTLPKTLGISQFSRTLF